MPFDGILTNNICKELNKTLSGGRIGKIYQIGKDAVIIQIRAGGENHKLLLCCNPASARIHLTQKQYENPDTPPVFCMILRKHLSGGIITDISSNNFERIVTIKAEVTDELGDRSNKSLIIEIMGRHSNIVLLNKNNIIIDAMKHIGSNVNRVRELLPARLYIMPPSQDKLDPSSESTLSFLVDEAPSSGRRIESFLLDKLQGFSPILCREICYRAGVDESMPANKISPGQIKRITEELSRLMTSLEHIGYNPTLVYENDNRPVDYHCIKLSQFALSKSFDTISYVVEEYYSEKNALEFTTQKTNTLYKNISKLLEKSEKRLGVNLQTYEDNNEFEKLRLFGELITANIYALSKGMEQASLVNYYSEHSETILIPLDKNKSPQQNAQIYFKKYNKARTALSYAENEIKLLKDEITYLESVLFSIENSKTPQQLAEIRLELYEQGYLKVKRKKSNRVQTVKILPQSILSCDGFEILIGHNNKQNDKLTLKTARNEDIWLHVKNFSGSHVVIKTEGKDVPDSTLKEAAEFAAFFSKAKASNKVEVDYTHIRNVKKPAGAKPGMVTYINYHTLIVTPRKPETE